MEPARLFDVVGWIAMPGWLLLVFLPRWRWTQTITAGVLPAILAVCYLALFVNFFGQVPGGFHAFGSLAGVHSALVIDGMLLAGWIHYLAFDLFVGSWQVRDAQRVGLRHWFVLPCLFLTLMVGPVGLLAYLVLRGAIARRFSIPGVAADASPAG
jgi:ABA DEFICIENT 4-like